MKKKLIAIFICLLMLSATLVGINAQEKKFKDVSTGSWYTAAVNYCVEKGILSGTSETTFEPHTGMTRAMFVTVLGKYAGILFSLGLWAAAFSSGIYRINLMPRYYRDAWALNEATDAKTKKSCFIIQLLAGVIPFFILVIWGSNPVTLVILAQTVVGILLPIITIVLLVLMNNKKYLGNQSNNIPQNIALFITAAVTLAMTARTFINLFAMF